MIQLIEAPPRSGKSFFVVNYLVRFTEYDALYNEYVLQNNVLIISNIEGLKIRHWTLDYCLEKLPIEEFFTIENFENIKKKTGKNHIILAIDECHRLFPAGYKNKDVYDFFAYHGHIGLDILLCTQGIDSMSRMFNPLLEYVVKASPRSKKAFKYFTYKYHDLKGRFLYDKRLRENKLVFNAYSSFRQDEVNKPKSALVGWYAFILICFSLGGFLFYKGLTDIKNKGESVVTEQTEDKPVLADLAKTKTVAVEKSKQKRNEINVYLRKDKDGNTQLYNGEIVRLDVRGYLDKDDKTYVLTDRGILKQWANLNKKAMIVDAYADELQLSKVNIQVDEVEPKEIESNSEFAENIVEEEDEHKSKHDITSLLKSDYMVKAKEERLHLEKVNEFLNRPVKLDS